MVFENHRKSLIQNCERSELRLRFEWTKVNLKLKNSNETFWVIFKQCECEENLNILNTYFFGFC